MESNLEQLVMRTEQEIEPYLAVIKENSLANHAKVLRAFRELEISDFCFNSSTGYGYGDVGRDTLDKLFAEVFGAEAGLVRTQFVSGTHAIFKSVFALLRPGDELVFATGTPYDTLKRAFGQLDQWGISYREVPLSHGLPDLNKIRECLTGKTKVVMIQRSRGYQERLSISISQISDIIETVKAVDPEILCVVDNCYGEFVETKEPPEVGADLTAGSLIKNPGGGIAPAGSYVVGREDLIYRVAEALTAPGLGPGIGATLTDTRNLYQGFFLAPHIVAEALKSAIFTACLFKNLGFEVSPQYNEQRSDIVQAVRMDDPQRLKDFCLYIQAESPVDSRAVPEPSMLPGYSDPVIMAAGTFVQGSSIELSADAPLRPPYWVYLQGGLTFEYSRISILEVTRHLIATGNIVFP